MALVLSRTPEPRWADVVRAAVCERRVETEGDEPRAAESLLPSASGYATFTSQPVANVVEIRIAVARRQRDLDPQLAARVHRPAGPANGPVEREHRHPPSRPPRACRAASERRRSCVRADQGRARPPGRRPRDCRPRSTLPARGRSGPPAARRASGRERPGRRQRRARRTSSQTAQSGCASSISGAAVGAIVRRHSQDDSADDRVGPQRRKPELRVARRSPGRAAAAFACGAGAAFPAGEDGHHGRRHQDVSPAQLHQCSPEYARS